MDNNITIILELLSAGVIAALVTGIFSLVIAMKNNKRLIELENSKQKFTVDQERFKGLRDAYSELLSLLPEEKLLGHVIMNLPSKEGFQESGLTESYEIAENNMKIMYFHFQKYRYLLLDDEQKKVTYAVEEIDAITKSIISRSSGYNTDENSDTKDSFDTIHVKIIERIVKVTEFEDMYYNLFKNSLSRLSKLSS